MNRSAIIILSLLLIGVGRGNDFNVDTSASLWPEYSPSSVPFMGAGECTSSNAVYVTQGIGRSCDICGAQWTEFEPTWSYAAFTCNNFDRFSMDPMLSGLSVAVYGLRLCEHCRDSYAKEIQSTMDKLIADLKAREKTRIEARQKAEKVKRLREIDDKLKELQKEREGLRGDENATDRRQVAQGEAKEEMRRINSQIHECRDQINRLTER